MSPVPKQAGFVVPYSGARKVSRYDFEVAGAG